MRAALLALALLTPAAAGAAELPAEFSGIWRIANGSDSPCRTDDPDYAAEGHMIVKPGAVLRYEWQCRIVSVRGATPGTPATVDVRLACEGEGMRWSAREIWHADTIDGKNVAVVTSLGHSDYRDAKGRRERVPNRITTSIYAACR